MKNWVAWNELVFCSGPQSTKFPNKMNVLCSLLGLRILMDLKVAFLSLELFQALSQSVDTLSSEAAHLDSSAT